MEKTLLHVEGMSCDHCVKAIKGAVEALDGVTNVSVDLAGKTAEVEYDSAKCTLDKIKFEIEDQGYEVVG